jgi:trans-aconitate methyltransferase
MIDPTTRARLYQAQYQSHTLDLPFWITLAAETGDPILEMGCGTGRLVAALAQRGYRVIGLDRDTAMLARAKDTLNPRLKNGVTWLSSELVSFHTSEPIRLAIGALNTFAYLDDEMFCAALASARDCLAAGGLIALDLPSFDPQPAATLEHEEPLDVFNDAELGTSIELRAEVDDTNLAQVEVRWLFDELHPDGTVKRHLWKQIYYQRELDQLEQLVRTCGLCIRATHGSYHFSPYQSDSERLLMILEKA